MEIKQVVKDGRITAEEPSHDVATFENMTASGLSASWSTQTQKQNVYLQHKGNKADTAKQNYSQENINASTC